MADIQVSTKRYYLTADRTRAVEQGDPDAAVLLVGQGSPIAPEVAAHYGIETESAVAMAKVPVDLEAERAAMVTVGTTKQTAANYDKMQLTRAVNEEVNEVVTRTGNPAAARQASMLAEGVVNQTLTEQSEGGEETPGLSKSADSTGGKGGAPVTDTSAVTKDGEETTGAKPAASKTSSRSKTIGSSNPPTYEQPDQTTTEKKDDLERDLNTPPPE